MDKIWLKHYPPDVPAEVSVSQYTSLVGLLEESFGAFSLFSFQTIFFA